MNDAYEYLGPSNGGVAPPPPPPPPPHAESELDEVKAKASGSKEPIGKKCSKENGGSKEKVENNSKRKEKKKNKHSKSKEKSKEETEPVDKYYMKLRMTIGISAFFLSLILLVLAIIMK